MRQRPIFEASSVAGTRAIFPDGELKVAGSPVDMELLIRHFSIESNVTVLRHDSHGLRGEMIQHCKIDGLHLRHIQLVLTYLTQHKDLRSFLTVQKIFTIRHLTQ